MKSPLLFMAGLFIGFLVEKCVAFGWHRFRFSPCLMRKRVQKSQAILALLPFIAFRSCISSGKAALLLYVMFVFYI